MKKVLLAAAGAIIIVVLIAVSVGMIVTADRQAPEIKIEDMDITYVEGQRYSTLLAGVTAYDSKDGDVSDSVMVESVVPLKSGEEAVVWYVAKDKSNNISRLDRIVKYQGESNGFISSDKTQSETEPTGGGGEESSADIKESQSQTQPETQSKPQQETQGSKEESTPYSGVKPVLILKSKEATIKVGGTFNVVSYVDNIIDDTDDRTTLFRRIIADGNYDTTVPGDYTLSIYCTDTDKNASQREQLILHVVQ